jgi:hypothetical protein
MTDKLPEKLPELTLCAPLVGGSTQTKRLQQGGFNEGRKYQFTHTQVEMVAIKYSYQQALAQIERNDQLLEWARENETLQSGKIAKLEQRLAEAQKYDLRQYIPRGYYCEAKPCRPCSFYQSGMSLRYCSLLRRDMQDMVGVHNYASAVLKAPGCPVPAPKEERQNA